MHLWEEHLQYLASKLYSCCSMLLKIITFSNNVYLQFVKEYFEDYMSLNTWTNARFKKEYFPSAVPQSPYCMGSHSPVQALRCVFNLSIQGMLFPVCRGL